LSLRDILVLLVVFGATAYALKHTWVGVLAWTWISLMNPHRLGWGVAVNFPVAAMVGGATLVSFVMTKNKRFDIWTPASVALAAFLVLHLIAQPFAFYPSYAKDMLVTVLKIWVMIFVAMTVLVERRQLDMLIWVIVGSLCFFGVKGGIFTILSGGNFRVWGPPTSFIEGNNELALALIMTIPLMRYLQLQLIKPWQRNLMTVAMALMAIAAIGSQSRGALLAIVAMSGILIMRSRNRLGLSVVVLIGAAILFAFMPDSWHSRMSTIQTYEEDASAMGRINAWWTAYYVAKANFFGGGFEMWAPQTYAIYSPNPRDVLVAHSIYFQVLGEHGFIGLFLFLLMWILTYREFGKLRKFGQTHEACRWMADLAGMCQVSIVGYLVGGTFLSLAYFDFPYNLLVISVCVSRLARDHRKTLAVKAPAFRPGPAMHLHHPGVRS
jgi:probable O-glycosylation ligase (exosortase A-associated)